MRANHRRWLTGLTVLLVVGFAACGVRLSARHRA
jgi:hypothetical protein